ncbi:hypothetical protein GQ53DRAFT_311446 [Thozetella sp. PMI_491]|nr:hypothetical protein GQ53DRAFT_311446 [Thozetella sp. PMI_491]
MSQLGDKADSKARDPPPTLFLHPSPTASHVSLPGIMAQGVPSTSTAPGQQPAPRSNVLAPRDAPASMASPTDTRRTAAAGVPGPLNFHLPLQIPHRESTRATDRTDALWAEMQATLEEVELSASGGTRVFRADHESKLAELRAAQIALAQAWARSEADDAIETMGGALGEMRTLRAAGGPSGADPSGVDAAAGGKGDGAAAAATDAAKSASGAGGTRPGSSGGQERLGAKLEEETEVDILLARKRREANDRYFERVNRGVLDVVAKLEEVATAMRAVEQESKDIWAEGEDESVPGSART